MFFEHADASGMSRRTSDKDGDVIHGDGGEGAPVETDPLGGNVGTATPYIELAPPWEPPQEFPMLQPFFEDSSAFVNGQRVTCSLDGFAIGCSQAFSMLGHSADIDFARTSSWVLGQLGIFAVWTPNQANPYTPPTPEPGVIQVNTATSGGGHWEYFGNVSWGSQTVQLAPLPIDRGTAINNALKEVIDFLKKGEFSDDCKKNVIDKLNGISGFSVDKFVNFLEGGGDFFDGTRSAALAKDYNPAYGYNDTTTVADSFKISPQTNARTANGINSKFTVFFRPDTIEKKEKTSRLTGEKISGITNDNLAFILHEGLHGYGHNTKSSSYFDPDLQKAFGLAEGAASINISQHIKDNCF